MIRISHQSGIALLQVLALCLLLPALLLGMQTLASSVLAQKQLIRHSQSSRRSALSSLDSNDLLRATDTPSMTCQRSPAQKQLIARLCWNGRLALFDKLPIFQHNFCINKIQASAEHSYTGRTLSVHSLRSQYLCLNPPANEGAIILNSNVEIDQPVEFEGIFSSGYIEISAPLRSSNNILIEAGGDIFIDSLSLGKESRILLLSHTGSIIVSSGTEDGEICASAPRAVSAYRSYRSLEDCGVRKTFIPYSLELISNET